MFHIYSNQVSKSLSGNESILRATNTTSCNLLPPIYLTFQIAIPFISFTEPNLLSHTAHSVARKGVKKRDLSDVELREILSELLPLVRMDHVAPTSSDMLSQAIRRGLVSTPPSHMIGSDTRDSVRLNAWVRTSPNSNGLFVRPRLFMPYYEEIKVCRIAFFDKPYEMNTYALI